MANRVILGLRGAEYGLWVSKPGKDVLTITANSDFLLRTDFKAAQIVQAGRIPQTGASFVATTVNIPDLGYRPTLEFESVGWQRIVAQWLSDTSFQFRIPPNATGYVQQASGLTPGGSASQRYISYRVWSMPHSG